MTLLGTPFALLGALLVVTGFAGMLLGRGLLRRLIAFNIAGSGLFLLFGALSSRMDRAAPHPGADPVPQAMIITGIVVALAATALGVAIARRLASGEGEAPPDA